MEAIIPPVFLIATTIFLMLIFKRMSVSEIEIAQLIKQLTRIADALEKKIEKK